MRPISADTLVVVPARRAFSTTDVRLVAPMRSFVSCARGACLWYDADRDAIALVRFGPDGQAVQGGEGAR